MTGPQEQEAREAHVPAISHRTDGRWGVYCLACSDQAGDYTYPCRRGHWDEDSPPALAAPSAPARQVDEEVERLRQEVKVLRYNHADGARADVEAIAAKVHEAWMDTKRAQGVESRPSEWGEEQMVPYADLSERAKDLDRGTVVAVLDAMDALAAPPLRCSRRCSEMHQYDEQCALGPAVARSSRQEPDTGEEGGR